MHTTRIRKLEMTHAEWLAERKKGIGSSDVGFILGLNPYRTPLEVYEEKITPVGKEPDMNAAMEWGLRLEPVVADAYAEKSGRRVHRDNMIRVHPEHEFMLANLDRVILPENGEGRGILECKTTSGNFFRTWNEEVPLSYFAQVQHQMWVADLKWAVVAVLVDGREFYSFDLRRDDEYLGFQVKELLEFWQMVEARTPPPLQLPDFERTISRPGTCVEATSEILVELDMYRKTSAGVKVLEAQKEEAGKRIKEFVGEREAVTLDGRILATWKSSKAPRVFDMESFKAKYPRVVEKYTIDGTSSRKFLVKAEKVNE